MKIKKILATLLALVMLLSCLSVTAFADTALTNQTTKQTWSGGTYTVSSGVVTLSGGVEVTGDVTLNISEGATLVINGANGANGTDYEEDESEGTSGDPGTDALTVSSGTLTVTGAGTLQVTGGAGGNGGGFRDGPTCVGGAAGAGIVIQSGSTLVISNGAVTAAGGNGGSGGISQDPFGDDGNGGDGGIAINCAGTLRIDSGTVTAAGGNGGTGYGGGKGGYAIQYTGAMEINGGTVTAVGGTGMDNGSSGIMNYNNLGSLTVTAGTLTTTGTNYGLSGPMTVTGGTVTVSGECSANGKTINISGGEVSFSAAFKTGLGGTITISGGKLSLASAPVKNGSGTVTITGGLFNMDMTSLLTGDCLCVSNTDNDTKNTYPYKVECGCYLDLESSATYLDSKTVNQTYILTASGDPVYTDVTKVEVTWTLPDIAATYTANMTWNPDTLQWTESKTTADIGQKTATFTFTNYSSVAIGAKLSFTKSIGTASDPYTSDVLTLEGLTNPDTHEKKSSAQASGTITHTYTPTASDFNSVAAGTGTYGTYTVTIVSAVKVTFDMNGHGNAIDAQYVGTGGKVTAPTNPTAAGFTFGGWYENAGCTGTAWNFTTGAVSADKTLYAKWTENS